ncbi:YtxH domain-containing protein [Clostridioides difficile]|nr:YtxH domain-containing protein [Clostridioides difficile]MDB0440281.1 YtxH domain-containing protein [Clostridioides difficile]
MCNKRGCKKGGFLLIGAILGFIFGMFLAPKKGSELRKETKDKFDKVKENPKEVLHETFNDVKERIITLVDDDNSEEDIKISEEDIVISKSFDDEGDVN